MNVALVEYAELCRLMVVKFLWMVASSTGEFGIVYLRSRRAEGSVGILQSLASVAPAAA